MLKGVKKHVIGIVSENDIVNTIYRHSLLQQPFFQQLHEMGLLEIRLGIISDPLLEKLKNGIDNNTRRYLEEQEITLDGLVQFSKADDEFFSELDSVVYIGNIDTLPPSASTDEKFFRAYSHPPGGGNYPVSNLVPISPTQLKAVSTWAKTDAEIFQDQYVTTGFRRYNVLFVDKNGVGRSPLATAIWEYLEKENNPGENIFTTKCAGLEDIGSKYDGRAFQMVESIVEFYGLGLDSSTYSSSGTVDETLYQIADAIFFLEKPDDETLVQRLRDQGKKVIVMEIDDPYKKGQNSEADIWLRMNATYNELYVKLEAVYDTFVKYAKEKPLEQITL